MFNVTLSLPSTSLQSFDIMRASISKQIQISEELKSINNKCWICTSQI